MKKLDWWDAAVYGSVFFAVGALFFVGAVKLLPIDSPATCSLNGATGCATAAFATPYVAACGAMVSMVIAIAFFRTQHKDV